MFLYCSPEPVVSATKTLDWLLEQIEGDSIEDVTDEMLDKLVSGHLAGDGFCKLNSWALILNMVIDHKCKKREKG